MSAIRHFVDLVDVPAGDLRRMIDDARAMKAKRLNGGRPLAGKTLQIEVRERKRLGSMHMIASTITCDGQIVASGDLCLYA